MVKKRIVRRKKLLPFQKPWAPFRSRKSSRDFNDLEKTVRALVLRFGYLRVLKHLVGVAGDQSLAALEQRSGSFRSYREAATLLDHAYRTLDTIVRLIDEAAPKEDAG